MAQDQNSEAYERYILAQFNLSDPKDIEKE
jgi:hypothetical protein